jgi:hypothetical protein
MAAVAALRPRPAKLFALVSHILRNGFFLVHGFANWMISGVHLKWMATHAVTQLKAKSATGAAFALPDHGL